MDQMLEKLEDEENQISWKNQVREVLKQLQGIYAYSAYSRRIQLFDERLDCFNEGKLARRKWCLGALSMISENINARYALLPTFSQDAVSCESACLGYVLGNSQNEQKENAAVDFLKYMLSEKVQKRILEETEQIPQMNTWCWMPTRRQCPVCTRRLLWCLELTGKLKFRITCGRQIRRPILQAIFSAY